MKFTYLFTIILNILIAFFFSKTFLLTNNTLKNNQHWEAEKENLEMGVMGSWNFFNKTQPLNHGYINLGSWHGFQEITTKQELEFDYIEFDAFFSKNSYLMNHFLINEGRRFSIKISEEKQESSCLVIDQSGKFLDKKVLNNVQVSNEEWSHVEISLQGTRADIKINGEEFDCFVPLTSKSKLGFKGGYNDTLIDNIIVKNDNKDVFREGFSNDKNLVFYFLSVFWLLSLIELFLFKVLKNRKKFLFFITTVSISALFSLIIFYIYLLFFFVGNYPNITSIINKIRFQEKEWVDNEFQIISQDIMASYEDDNSEKIMFIGSSQTWGAGASKKKNSFPFVFEKLLNDLLLENQQSISLGKQVMAVGPNSKIRVINAASSGVTSIELLQEYKTKWIELSPKVAIINLSSNDFTNEVSEKLFRENISSFIEINREKNIETIFLLEANSSEVKIDNNFHSVLKDICIKEEITFIDVNDYLKKKDNSGLIWWDFIHPTDYGHRLIAHYIFDTLVKR
jgi:lysophospholipase L1-like esterase